MLFIAFALFASLSRTNVVGFLLRGGQQSTSSKRKMPDLAMEKRLKLFGVDVSPPYPSTHLPWGGGNRTSWNEWRWSNAERMGAQSRPNRRPGILLDKAAQKCANIAHALVPASIKFDETLDNETAYYSASLADHIYVLCKQCDRTFPSNWKGKVTYVPATDADDCLDSGRMLHDEKVTRAHKLIVWAARNLKFRKILVLEEDFVLAPSTGLKATTSQALMEFIEAGEWDLLRLGYIARDVFVQSGQKRQCKPSCSCTVDVSCGDVCTTAPGCDLRSSVAYMIKEHLFEDFLAAQGVIDLGILQSFKQYYLIPPLFHQGGEKFAVGTELDKDFTASCVHG